MSKKILFVDDEPMNLVLIEAYLSEMLDIETALSASDALALLDKDADKYFMIVSDLRMPLMDGFELLSIVREKHPDIRRLLYTAYFNTKEISAKVEDGTIEKVYQKTGDMNNFTQDFLNFLNPEIQ